LKKMSSLFSFDDTYLQCKKTVEKIRSQIIAKQKQNIEDNPAPLKETYQKQHNRDHNNNNNAHRLNLRCRLTLRGHYGKIYSLAWSSLNEIATISQDLKLIVWNGQTGHKKAIIPLPEIFQMTVAFSPNGQFIATGGLDNICKIYKPPDSKYVHQLQAHNGYISCNRYLNNEQILTSSGDSFINLWDIERQQVRYVFSGHQSDVMSIAETSSNSPNKSNSNTSGIFLSCSTDKTVKLWDSRENVQNKCTMTFYGHNSDVNCVRWFPDNITFASGGDEGIVRLFDIRSYRQLNYYKTQAKQIAVMSLGFSQSGRYLFAGYDDAPYCLVFDTQTGTIETQLLHSDRITTIELSPTNNSVAAASWDMLTKIWA